MSGKEAADCEDLPQGWNKWWSERRKKFYYHNEETGTVQWEPPGAPPSPSKRKSSSLDPPGDGKPEHQSVIGVTEKPGILVTLKDMMLVVLEVILWRLYSHEKWELLGAFCRKQWSAGGERRRTRGDRRTFPTRQWDC